MRLERGFQTSPGAAVRSRRSRSGLGLAALLWLGGLSGCATHGPPAAATWSKAGQPGWKVQQGQAVWRPPGGAPELAGEFFIASHVSGRCLVQFSKSPITLVAVELGPSGWKIEFPPEKRRRRGRGQLPSSPAWLHVPAVARGETPPAWRCSKLGSDGWRLEHESTKEWLEFHLWD